MTKQVYEDLKELEAVYKKLTCSIQQAFNLTELTELKPVIHAKWERLKDDECAFICSVCHYDAMYMSNYCPACGAKMDEENDVQNK